MATGTTREDSDVFDFGASPQISQELAERLQRLVGFAQRSLTTANGQDSQSARIFLRIAARELAYSSLGETEKLELLGRIQQIAKSMARGALQR